VSWKIDGDPHRQATSADETCWLVPLVRDDGAETSVLAAVSGSAMSMAEEALPNRVAEMRRTHGVSQVEFYFPWAEPPRQISADSHCVLVELAGGMIVQSFGE
jgi:hypothetical protein